MARVPGMHERFGAFPRALAERTRTLRLAGVPALIAHPDWKTPAPVMVWMHGRTVSKELDPGRYLRWVRAGIAAVALDLPGHGERFDAALQPPDRTLDVLEQMLGEVDAVTDALAAREYEGVLDVGRMGLGGMSAGGMVALRRLCEGHEFSCAAVEGTTGWLEGLYLAGGRTPWGATHDPARVRALDAMSRLSGWRPIPLLALHSRADEVVPVATQERFVEAVRARCVEAGADPGMVRLRTWEKTGAPWEHAGFGLVANDAKSEQVEFLTRCLVGQKEAADGDALPEVRG